MSKSFAIFRTAVKVACLLSSFFGVCVVSTLAFTSPLTLVPTITTFTGTGIAGDSVSPIAAAGAPINSPQAIAIDAAGNVYFAEYQNSVIRKVDIKSGVMTIVAGKDGVFGFSGDGGIATSASLNRPTGIRFDIFGNLYISDSNNSVVRRVDAATNIITTIAGTPLVSSFSGDGGAATSATLNDPWALAFDRAGSLYIADAANNAIRKVSGGVISTIAGTGAAGFSGDGGPAVSALLNNPTGVAFDAAGNLYIADGFNFVIRKVVAGTGVITTTAGTAGMQGSLGDMGAATSAQLGWPVSVEVDSAGDLYISDYANNAIRKTDAATGIITTAVGTLSSQGYRGDGGAATGGAMTNPTGVAIDGAGNLYIADHGNSAIRFVSVHSSFPATAVGSSASRNLILHLNQSLSISRIFVHPSLGNIQEYTPGAISGCVVDGTTTNAAGTDCIIPITFSPAYPGLRGLPVEIDTSWGQYKFALNGVGLGPQAGFTPGLITTLAGNGIAGYSGDYNLSVLARLNAPNGVTVNSQGFLYIADSNNQVLREVDGQPALMHPFAGTPGSAGFSGDGGPRYYANLDYPYGISADGADNYYIADKVNSVIREITNGFISTVAGQGGVAGYSGDGGPAANATLNHPTDEAYDAVGNLYIADSANNVIREVNASTGIITTVAGIQGAGGYSGDGGSAKSALLSNPTALAIDAAGNLYISDANNFVIRKVAAGTGIISTIAGTGVQGYSGDGGPATSARLNDSEGLALDSAANLYIADSGNNVVRKLSTTTGTITSIAGIGDPNVSGFSGDHGAATAAQLAFPMHPALDSAGTLYIADHLNNAVRAVSGSAPLNFAIRNINTTSPAQDVTITNNGNVALTFTALNAPVDFDLNGADTTCTPTGTLAPGQSCVLGIEFSPTIVNTFSDVITLLDNQGSQTIPVSGESFYQAPTTATLAVFPAQPNPGETITLVATIKTTGSLNYVDFYDRAHSFAHVGFSGVNAAGLAILSIPNIQAGFYDFIAGYQGNTTTANAITSFVSVNVIAPQATITTLAITPGTPVSAGTAVTLTATLTSLGIPVSTGAVNFCDATATYCDGTALLGTAQVNSSGIATLRFIPGAGTYSIKAVFLGVRSYVASISAAQMLTVNVASSYPSFTSIAFSGTAGNYTLTGTVSAFGVIPPAGTVSFLNTSAANAVLGSSTLDAATLGQSFLKAIIPLGTVSWEAVGDFNGDGIPDLVAAKNVANGSVSVLLGVGDGTFLPQVQYAVGSYPKYVTVADINHDGWLDIIVADSGSNDVGVLLGNGDGTFQAVLRSPAGNQPSYVVVADLDRHGIMDIVTTNPHDYTISVLLGNGDGTFQAPVTYPVGAASGIAVADFNHDGIADLAVTNAVAYPAPLESTVSLLLGIGDGSFQVGGTVYLPPNVSPSAPAAADLRQNGTMDLVVADSNAPAAWVLLGNNDGTFPSVRSYSVQASALSVSVGDVNHDGILDLIVPDDDRDDSGGSVSILPGNGDGTFQPRTDLVLGTYKGPHVAVLADFNGDGLLDIATADVGFGDTSVLLQQQTETATVAGIAVSGSISQNVLASYAGDASRRQSQSSTTPLQGRNQTTTPTTTLLTSSPSSIYVGQTVTFTASVVPTPTGTPLGNITFYSGGAMIGTGTISVRGIATAVIANVPLGSRTVYAAYSGNVLFATSTSANITSRVSLAPTATTLGSSSLSPAAGSNVTITATILPIPTGTPLGTMNFYDGVTLLGAAAVNSSGAAVYSISGISGGSHPVTAVYSGNSAFAASTSGALVENVGAAGTVTTLASSTMTPVLGANVTLTATIAPLPTGSPLGSVSYYNGSSLLGSAAVDSSGTATLLIGNLPLGTDVITAVYSGNAAVGASTSSAIIEQVSPATAAVTATTLTSSNPIAAAGANVTFTATVSPTPSGSGYPAPVPTPIGTISFFNGAHLLGTVTVNPSGSATLAIGSLPLGTNSIAALYSGNANFGSSVSPALTEIVNPNSVIVTTAVTGPTSILAYGQTLTASTTLAGSAIGTAGGTVTYTVNGSSLASVAVSNGVVAIATLPILAPGMYSLLASYSGDAANAANSGTINFTISAPQLTLTVANATRLYGVPNPIFTGTITGAANGDSFTESFTAAATLASAPGTYAIVPMATGAHLADYTETPMNGSLTVAQAGSSVTVTLPAAMTVNVAAPMAITVSSMTSGTPTGTVTLYSGTTVLGTATIGVGGTATYSLTPAVAGSQSFSAIYIGDMNFSSASSASVPVIVNPSFAMTAPATSFTLAAGASVDVPINVAPLGGSYSNAISMSVTGLPAGASATFNPQIVTPGAAGAVSTMTISLAKQTASLLHSAPGSGNTPGPPLSPVLPLLGTATGLLVMVRRRGRFPKALLVMIAAVALAATALITSCGGITSTSVSTPPVSTPPVTTPPVTTPPATQTYTVTVTGTGGTLQASTVVTIIAP